AAMSWPRTIWAPFALDTAPLGLGAPGLTCVEAAGSAFLFGCVDMNGSLSCDSRAILLPRNRPHYVVTQHHRQLNSITCAINFVSDRAAGDQASSAAPRDHSPGTPGAVAPARPTANCPPADWRAAP